MLKIYLKKVYFITCGEVELVSVLKNKCNNFSLCFINVLKLLRKQHKCNASVSMCVCVCLCVVIVSRFDKRVCQMPSLRLLYIYIDVCISIPKCKYIIIYVYMCVCQCVHGSIFTLGSLLEAPPQGAGLAADTRGSAGAGVQWDGPDHQRQRQVQVETPRNVHINLPGRMGGKQTQTETGLAGMAEGVFFLYVTMYCWLSERIYSLHLTASFLWPKTTQIRVL